MSDPRRSCGWRMRPVVLSLLAAGVLAPFLLARPGAAFEWGLPVGFPTPKVPSDNPPTQEKVALGRLLFYDVRLSGNLTQSCASCHRQALAFTDGLTNGIGSTGQVHPRNSMSLTNAGYASTLAWASDILMQLEQQALVPMFGEDPVELGLSGMEEELIARVRSDARYRRLFAEAFPQDDEPIGLPNLVRALTSFVRTLISGSAPYDRFVQAIDDEALSLSAQRGGRLFFSERLECFHCHGGFNLALNTTFAGQAFDESAFQNNGLYNIDGQGAYPPDNTGLFERSRIPEDMGAFKAPTLRNIELTDPYMHDGSIATLEEVLDHYMAGGRTITEGPYAGDGSRNPFKNNFVRGFSLSAEEREDVLSFLKGLTDREYVSNPAFADPFTANSCAADCNLNGAVSAAEVRNGIEGALDAMPLGRCLAADRDGDGAIHIDELTLAVSQAAQGCQLAKNSGELLIGSTLPGGGELALAGGLTPQVELEELCSQGGGASAVCDEVTSLYAVSKPRFAGLAQRGYSPLYPLADGTKVRVEIHTAIAPGAALRIGDTTLDALGDTADLGMAPAFAEDVIWSLEWPKAKPRPRQVTLWFQLVGNNDAYRASQPIAAVLLLERGETQP